MVILGHTRSMERRSQKLARRSMHTRMVGRQIENPLAMCFRLPQSRRREGRPKTKKSRRIRRSRHCHTRMCRPSHVEALVECKRPAASGSEGVRLSGKPPVSFLLVLTLCQMEDTSEKLRIRVRQEHRTASGFPSERSSNCKAASDFRQPPAMHLAFASRAERK